MSTAARGGSPAQAALGYRVMQLVVGIACMVAIANLHKPDPAKPGQFELLYPEGGGAPGTPNLQRAQTVLGLYEFAAAAQNLPLAWYALEQRVLQSIHAEREGSSMVKDGKVVRSQAFIDKYDGEIQGIQAVDAHVVAFDPIMSCLTGLTNANSDKDVRQALTPLNEVLVRTRWFVHQCAPPLSIADSAGEDNR